MDLINVGTGREERGGVFELYVWSLRRERRGIKKKKERKGAERLVSGGRMTYFRWQMCARA